MVAKPWILALVAVVSLAAAPATSAQGETIVVNTLEDIVDFGGARRVSDLPGPDGRISFREACTAVNNTAGPQTIHFAIPRNEWWLYNDRALLKLEDGYFGLTDDGTTIDFSTQTSFTGDTNPDGNEVGIYGLEPNAWGVTAIWIFANHCTIRGLDAVHQRGYGVEIRGNDNRVVGCSIFGPWYAAVRITGNYLGPTASRNIVGGTSPDDGNYLEGIGILGPANDNIVIGNVVVGGGINVTSAIDYDMIASNTRIGGQSPEERNVIYGVGYYGEEGFPVGTHIYLTEAVSTLVEGNYIGIREDGVTPGVQVGPTGIGVLRSTDTIIRGNVIGAMITQGYNHYAGQVFGEGISVTDVSLRTTIVDNKIGTDASGLVPIPNLVGVRVSPWLLPRIPSETFVGGPSAGMGNLIAFNVGEGVRIESTAVGVVVSGNSIHGNGGLGIDLVNISAGVSPNDIGDGDTGPNNLQNFPVLDDAISIGPSTFVSGTLKSSPLDLFTIELFASESCDPSGHGEGRRFLGSTVVETDASGLGSFHVYLAARASVGESVTGTATDSAGNTSEFSMCFGVRSRSMGPSGPPVLTK